MRKKHFTLIEIMIVVAIIALLALIALPNFIKARQAARATTCIANLKQIHGAKQQWAIQENQPESAEPGAADISDYFTGGLSGVYCPIDPAETFASSYTIGALQVVPVCQKDPGGDNEHVIPGN